MDNLLKTLIDDEKKIDRSLYSSGPYWNYKNTRTIYQLKKKSLKNFRGLHSGVGSSFCDNLVYDTRNEYNFKGRLVSLFYSLPIIKKIYESQLKVTSGYINNFIKNQSIIYQNDERVDYLIKNYVFKNTTEFGCVQKFTLNGKEYSTFYLEMANRIDYLKKTFDFENIKNYIEIGGGFGANIHLILENFKNIKKIVYLDVVPNIYIGTEYLRNFYKDSVKDYLQTQKMNEIKFNNNDKLEIICIPPWEIEKLNIQIDHFHNAASFVEMPTKVIENYVKYIIKNKTNEISLISYCNYDSKTTFDPKKLNNYFDNKLIIEKHPTVIDKYKRNDLYLIKKSNNAK